MSLALSKTENDKEDDFTSLTLWKEENAKEDKFEDAYEIIPAATSMNVSIKNNACNNRVNIYCQALLCTKLTHLIITIILSDRYYF